MAHQVPLDQFGDLSFAFKTKGGKDAKIDGTPTVTSSDETVAKFTIEGSNIVCDPQAPGTATVTLTGDADLGAGVVPVSATADFEIPGENAESVEFGGSVVLRPKPTP
jgi:hypothetical protein